MFFTKLWESSSGSWCKSKKKGVKTHLSIAFESTRIFKIANNVSGGFATNQLLLEVKRQEARAAPKTCYNSQSDHIYLWRVKDVFDLHEVGDVPGVLWDGAERKPIIPHKRWQNKQCLYYIHLHFPHEQKKKHFKLPKGVADTMYFNYRKLLLHLLWSWAAASSWSPWKDAAAGRRRTPGGCGTPEAPVSLIDFQNKRIVKGPLLQCFSTTALRHISVSWELVLCAVEKWQISANWSRCDLFNASIIFVRLSVWAA